ncbi:H+/Cl- antiporter ClcA [Sulfitobacter undariae]|uniref:H+/Cl- antiporter ClcA n=1 Tax=Sulfitobacter undariae TaxID=1563671 RepID=A0A7W6H0Q2_9RHOB|nr:chloride channel protein [Sulfitobacter undariae]MBB3994835.1 H+/Cl- antiporter ClcA [Sulfitobacter undariae]
MRSTALAAGYGFVAGVVAALVLWLMGLVSAVVWSGPDASWYIFVMIMLGGVCIAVLRHWHEGESLSEQIEDIRNPSAPKHRDTVLLAAMAIIAVGFGGAVGPEAGILAVVAEMSAFVTLLIARNQEDSRMISEVGAVAALSGIYGSPPGAAMMTETKPEAPKWQLFLAALAGLLGFMLVASRFLPDGAIRIHLPVYQAARDGTDMLRALLPAGLGTAVGLAFVMIHTPMRALLARCGPVAVQTLIGTALFAALAAIFPILRFSGHHELEAMLEWGAGAGMGLLITLALLKMLALSVCLAAGWRGGAAFPLIFAGAAAGGAALWVMPDIPITVALVPGMAAALTAGMGQPIAAMLIALLLIGPAAMGPLLVGILIGWGGSKLVTKPVLH